MQTTVIAWFFWKSMRSSCRSQIVCLGQDSWDMCRSHRWVTVQRMVSGMKSEQANNVYLFAQVRKAWEGHTVRSTSEYYYLLYTKQNTGRMLKFDWLRAGPYACVRIGVWTGWTSVHNNKGKHWLFVVLLVWVYNKALINLELGPYGKYLLWRHAAWTSTRSVRTAWRHNKYFRVWTALLVNNCIILADTCAMILVMIGY